MNIELNLCLRCNAKCPSCDRHVNYFPDRTDDMTLDQLTAFIDEAAVKKNVGRVKCVGGEPLCWPFFIPGYNMLVDALEAGKIGGLSINTNCVAKPPDGLKPCKRVRWQFSRLARKRHIPNCWAPVDLNVPWKPCSHPRRCGISLDNRGYLPCSPAISIVRLFGMEDIYRPCLPSDGKPWALDRVCPLCSYALPDDIRQAHVLPLAQFTPEMKRPTRSWAAALRRAGVEVPAVYEPAGVPVDEATLDRLDITD